MPTVDRKRTDEDARMVALARTGDRAAFEALIRLHTRAVHRLALRLVGNAEDAEDVVQEAFTKAYLNLEKFRGDCAFRTWLLHIGLSLCQDKLRRRQRRRGLAAALDVAAATEELPSTAPGPAGQAEVRDQTTALTKALDDLPPRQKAALLLKVYEGFSHREVASVLGTTPAAARVYLVLARQSLRRRFGEEPRRGGEP